MTAVSYAYAVARALDDTEIAGLTGVDGTAVRLVRHADLVVVVSSVPLADLDESRLERLDELAAVARAHHAVVHAVAAVSVALPFRLATAYQGDDGVLEVLRREHGRFRAALDRVAGRVEMGVKVYADQHATLVPAAPEGTGATPGKDYLRRRREARRSAEDAWQAAAAAARRVDTALGALAADRRHHRPQSSRLSGVSGDNVLNAAYLVDAGRVAEFTALAAGLGGAGTRVEVTGPWAAYSFALVGRSG
jgi:hypothetical protein